MNTLSQPASRKTRILRSTSMALGAALLLAAAPSIAAEALGVAPTAALAAAGERAARHDLEVHRSEHSERTALELGVELSQSETQVAAALRREMRDDIARRAPALDPVPHTAAAASPILREVTPVAASGADADAAALHPASNRDAIEHTRVFIAVKEGQAVPGALVQ